MFATALFLVSSSKLAGLLACWLLGVALVAGLFLYNRQRIRSQERDL